MRNRKQSAINPDQIIKVDFTGPAQALQPTVYKDRRTYFCVLGTDDKNGVVGTGSTVDQAISDWDKNLQARLKTGDQDDEVVKLVKGILDRHKKYGNEAEDFLAAHLRPFRK